MAEKKPMSEAVYAAGNGLLCPFCESPDIRAGIPETQDAYVFSSVACLICLRTWREWYEVSGYTWDCPECHETIAGALVEEHAPKCREEKKWTIS